MKSMTGFGKQSNSFEEYTIDIEIKSVNHRFLDISCRLPRECSSYELEIRRRIQKKVQRGRVECYINVEKRNKSDKKLSINWSLLDELVREISEASKIRYKEYSFDFSSILSGLLIHEEFIEVTETELHDDQFKQNLFLTLDKAIVQIVHSREEEGQQIKAILLQYAEDLEHYIQTIKGCSDEIETEYKARLLSKLQEFSNIQMDESRVLTEWAILVDKGDTHEELDRLSIHIIKMKDLFSKKEAIGRESDFFIQEINREINTIGSKSNSIEIKNNVVSLKTTLEKIREQIQNIE